MYNNSILQTASNSFPETIDAEVEKSNNPLGGWELNVCANGDLLGTFYYYSKEDAMSDLSILEDKFFMF